MSSTATLAAATPALYQIAAVEDLLSPALFFFKDVIRSNIAFMIKMGGSADRLRPHVKTHKTREIVRLELDAGIRKHKCATLAEAELLATSGATYVLLAYPLVGPNLARFGRLQHQYPSTHFSVLADHPGPLETLSAEMTRQALKAEILLDINVGQNRTGIAPGAEALHLYERLARLPGLQPGGFHVYDGHNHQEDPTARREAVLRGLAPVLDLRETLSRKGIPAPRLIVGGTPTFPIYTQLDYPGLELSPGTCVLHDNSYHRFTELSGLHPAGLLLTRVISRPLPNRITLDLGYKAVASDPPITKRAILLGAPPYEAVLQNEEHLVIETSTEHADQFQPGYAYLAVPHHICPTVALHRQAQVVEAGRVVDTWDIVGRDRVLTL